MKVKRLSADEFDRLAAVVLQETRMDDASIQLVRAVLVDQRMQTELAKSRGVSKQAISKLVSTFRRACAKLAPPGMGYVSVEMELPERLALELDSMMAKAKACSDVELQLKAVGLIMAAIDKARVLLRSSGA